jgi:hypothetical protein
VVPYQFAVDEETDTVTFIGLFAEVKFAVPDSRDDLPALLPEPRNAFDGIRSYRYDQCFCAFDHPLDGCRV